MYRIAVFGLSALLILAVPQLSAAGSSKKILFIAGNKSHGYMEHEFPGGSLLLRDALNRSGTDVWAQVSLGWPADPHAFDSVAAVVSYCDGESGHVWQGHWDFLDSLFRKGVGMAALHYAVHVDTGRPAQSMLAYLGGYFESYYSVNPIWTPRFEALPAHPIANGVAFEPEEDEWYFHMRFREGMAGITPILVTYWPSDKANDLPDGKYSGNPIVRADVQAGLPQTVAWAADNGSKGRGFGFTGSHFHRSWGHEAHQRVVLNALCWVAHGTMPSGGMPTLQLSQLEVDAYATKPIPPLSEQKQPPTVALVRASGDRHAIGSEAGRARQGRDWIGRKARRVRQTPLP